MFAKHVACVNAVNVNVLHAALAKHLAKVVTVNVANVNALNVAAAKRLAKDVAANVNVLNVVATNQKKPDVVDAQLNELK
jgi:hypothetical protein